MLAETSNKKEVGHWTDNGMENVSPNGQAKS